MEILKKRKTKLSSKKKLVNCVKLYEKYVDEPIESIVFRYSANILIINDKYRVDISNNSVVRIYPDPDYGTRC